VIDEESLAGLASRLRLRSYKDLRPSPDPYAQWTNDAEPGSVTDDSRHKLILLQALHYADGHASWPVTVESFARAHLDWSNGAAIKDNEGFEQLNADWLRDLLHSTRVRCRPGFGNLSRSGSRIAPGFNDR
jgi:hypothetical protein